MVKKKNHFPVTLTIPSTYKDLRIGQRKTLNQKKTKTKNKKHKKKIDHYQRISNNHRERHINFCD